MTHKYRKIINTLHINATITINIKRHTESFLRSSPPPAGPLPFREPTPQKGLGMTLSSMFDEYKKDRIHIGYGPLTSEEDISINNVSLRGASE